MEFVLIAFGVVLVSLALVQAKEIWTLQSRVAKLERRLSNAKVSIATQAHTHSAVVAFPDPRDEL